MATKRARSGTGPTKTEDRPLPRHWNWFANGPIKGCGLLRERQWIYVWDDANSIYLLDLKGEMIAQRRAPRELLHVTGSDDGKWLLAISRSSDVWWLDPSLTPRLEIHCPFDPLSCGLDPHGQYAVITGREGMNVICAQTGEKIAQFETTRPLKHIQFVPSQPTIIGVSECGMLCCHDLRGREQWHATVLCNVGGIALDGDADAVFLACFGHGIARFNSDGVKEGTYRFDQSPALVSIDFEGSTLLAASLERQLTELSFDGNIRATRSLPDRPVAMSLDALGRYLILGFANGELMFTSLSEYLSQSPALASMSGEARIRPTTLEPAWQKRLAVDPDEASSAVIERVGTSDRIAVYTSRRCVRVVDDAGEVIHESEQLPGIGRILRSADGWIAAASDSALLAYTADRNQSRRSDLSASEISHLQLLDSPGHAILIEGCYRLTRFRFPSQILWRHETEYRVDSVAVQPDGALALTLEDHNMIILDAQGRPAGKFRARPAEPMMVAPMDDGWATAARDERVIRGHEPNGALMWSRSLPWMPWSLRRLARYLVVTSPEGYSMLINQRGKPVAENSEPREGARYFVWKDDSIARWFQVDQTLIATSFSGKLLWRHVDEHRVGPSLACEKGAWVFLGRQLAYFPFD